MSDGVSNSLKIEFCLFSFQPQWIILYSNMPNLFPVLGPLHLWFPCSGNFFSLRLTHQPSYYLGLRSVPFERTSGHAAYSSLPDSITYPVLILCTLYYFWYIFYFTWWVFFCHWKASSERVVLCLPCSWLHPQCLEQAEPPGCSVRIWWMTRWSRSTSLALNSWLLESGSIGSWNFVYVLEF